MATTYILPLTYKAGINRDNTDFQPEYCNEGQWIRFNEGKVNKIGGMRSPGVIDQELDASYVSSINLLPHPTDNNKKVVYIAGSKLAKIEIKSDFSGPITKRQLTTVNNLPANILWQTQVLIDDNIQKMLFLATDNAKNISQSTQCKLYAVSTKQTNVNVTEVSQASFNVQVTGGMCWAAPFLFLYGDNGYVQYSVSGQPLNFDHSGETGKQIISDDKVVYAAPIRGGSNAPSVLFWTLSKVVRLTNTAEGNTPEFQKDTISNSSSILSSRSVAEYDGLFFWIGTDRFFVYNGVVQEMHNNVSMDFFFDNIDMNHRQKVFATINPRFGEIWWFYPEKGQDQNNVRNTRALIYNKRENSWYDTAISRDCGVFSSDIGSMITYGKSMTTVSDQTYLWRHETGINEVAGTEQATDSYINNGILSSVTTPYISQAAFNTQSPMQGVDRLLFLQAVEPDFKMADKTKEIILRVNTKRYAQENLTISSPTTFTGETLWVDTWIQGRAISLTFSSEHDFQMNNIMLEMADGDNN